MTLIERWHATETEAGKLIMKIAALAGTIIAATGEAAEYFNFIPQGFIPDWVKGAIGILALSGVVGGKLTAKKDEVKSKE